MTTITLSLNILGFEIVYFSLVVVAGHTSSFRNLCSLTSDGTQGPDRENAEY